MANIVPIQPKDTLKQTRVPINEQFKELNQDIIKHKASQQAHDATAIKYDGKVVGADNTKQAIDNVQEQVNTLVINGDSSAAAAQAAVDANGYNYGNLKRRLDEEHTQLSEQLADKAQQADVTDLEIKKADKTQVNALTVNKADKVYVDEAVASVSSGTPEAFVNLTAIQSAYPNGDTYVKLNLEDGYVYKWNGTAWEQGWKYQGEGLGDGTVTGTKLSSDLQNSLLVPVKNMFVNGDFSNGFTGWTNSSNTTVSVVDGILTMRATSQLARIRQNINRVSGKVYYIFTYVKTTSNLVGIHVYDVILAPHSGNGNYEYLSLLESGGNGNIPIGVADTRATGFDDVFVDYFGVIDLTETFGAGNEPSKSEMDALMSELFGGYVNVGNLFNAGVVLNDIKSLQARNQDIQQQIEDLSSGITNEYNKPALSFERVPYYASGETGYNATSYVQDNMCIANGYQYIAFTSADTRSCVVGKRSYPDGDWSFFDLSTLSGNPFNTPTNLDGHNVMSIAVDTDGFLHVVGDMHNGALTYVKSNNPHNITSWTKVTTMTGNESNMTYPRFIKNRNGVLYFLWRKTTAPGIGALYLNRYNTVTKTWSTVAAPLVDGTSATLTPYENRLEIDSNNVIHLSWTWRDTAGGGNKDICYAKSDDGGTTWKKSNGSTQPLPVTYSNADTILSLPISGAMLNQNGMMCDDSGRPHIAYFKRDSNGYTNIYHLYHNGSTWIDRKVTNLKKAITSVPAWRVELSRPSIFTHNNRVFILYRANYGDINGTLRLIEVTPSKQINDVSICNVPLEDYEPNFDTSALLYQKSLNMLVLSCSEDVMFTSELDTGLQLDNLNKQALNILSIDMRQIDKVLTRSVQLPKLEVISTHVAPINIAKTYNSSGGILSLREFGTLPIINDGDTVLLARLTARATADANSKLSIRLVNGSQLFNTVLFTKVTAPTSRQSAWRVLPSLDSGTLYVEADVELLNGATQASGSITALMIEIAVVKYA